MIIIRFIIILITAASVVTVAMAQEASAAEYASSRPKDDDSYQVDAAQNPLKPADTSSPSDTLRSFLTDMAIVIDERQEHGALLSLAGYQAYNRASSALDFSTTPDSDSRTIMNLRLAMLQEILARIELPPDGEIPGDDDLAQSTLNQWTIPGSRITIQRIEKGPRAGEFLFSAWTVQRLHRFYRQVKHLPYKPDATPGVYEAYLRSNSSVAYLERPVRNRLKPVDTSSPRSAFEGFLDSVNRAYVLLMEADAALKANPPTITRDEARKIETIAQNLMKRAGSTLDLSKVPGAIRDDVGIESVLRLKEIFDRMHLPPIESVPDLEMVKDERQRLSSTAVGNTRPVRWRYPNTTIEIVEIMDGEQQGNFLFSANTVRRLNQFYNTVRDLPYRGDYSQIALEYVSPETSQGFYEYYISTPGDLIPLDSFWGRLVDGLPGWFKTMYHGQTLWQWMSLVVVLALAVLFLVAFHGILLRRPAQLSVVNRNWRRVFFNLFTIGAVYILFWFLDDTVNLTGSVLMVVRTCLTLAVWYFLATGTLYLSNAIVETIIASPKIDPEGIQASYLRALFGIFGLATMAVLMVTGLFRVGVSLGPLLAGAGIGGLAIALAARPTLENVIGSFMIFLDKPFRVGQRVNVMGHNGTVESIGLRSTKIRLLTGNLTSIPNQQMADAEVENIGRRPYIRRLFNVTITYDTPPEKITRALEILREILSVPETPDPETTDATTEPADTTVAEKQADISAATKPPPALAAMIEDIDEEPHPNMAINQPDPDFKPRVYFNDLNADSLNIIVYYWYHPPVYWNYLEHATWINLQIMERFNAEGIDFAFPTQTLHMAGDEKRPLTVGQRWVSKEETFSPSAILAQAAALGVQAAQRPASDAVRPEVSETAESKPRVDGELTDAPLEDDVMHGASEGGAGDDEDADR